ncbi:DoxX family protein [Nocardia yamanashiensis]|uniref:DoxX family protein n=1 Tax=Nocardia yamanashiensis TaxID=209247 RepID=UPI001E45B0C7|nr:DoxX family protein [Nocardia yamanashiensis]UGT41183.1 DoxX family protein [Nocardia yamanashiensis]
MDVLVLIGRVLFVLLFLSSGFGHIAQADAMAQYAKFKGVPMPKPAVLASGVLLIAGGLSVLLGVWADLGALLLFVFLLPTAFLMHAFWKETDPQAKQTEMVSFNKDLALAGAALMLFAFFAYVGTDLGLTITGPLFSL